MHLRFSFSNMVGRARDRFNRLLSGFDPAIRLKSVGEAASDYSASKCGNSLTLASIVAYTMPWADDAQKAQSERTVKVLAAIGYLAMKQETELGAATRRVQAERSHNKQLVHIPLRAADARRSVENILRWNSYLPAECVRTMVRMGWDYTT